ncbi:hypothetical protein Tco_0421669 [Tanacetum coccineum]
MPYKIEQFSSLSDLEKKHTKSVYFRNEEDKRRGVNYAMNKILKNYKECLKLGPEYLTGLEENRECKVIFDEKKLWVSNEELEEPIEDHTLPTDASPTTLSPSYIADSYLEEDKKDPEEDPADHLVNGGDNDDNESSDDDDNDDDVEKDKEEEEEHLAPADSSDVPIDDHVPSS